MTTLILSLTQKQIGLKEILDKIRDLKPFSLNLLILCEKKHKIVTEFETFKQTLEQKSEAEETNAVNKKVKKVIKKNKENINLCAFPNGTKEESMINFGIKELPEGNFILLRNDVKEIDTILLKKMLAESQSGGDIIMVKRQKKKNIFKEFFSKIFGKIYSLIFNFNFYSGDIGVQYFSNFVRSVMKETNPTMLTKLNKWLAVNIKYLDFDAEPTLIKQKNYGKSKLTLGIIILSAAFLVGLTAVLDSILNLPFMIWLLIAFLFMILAILIVVTVFRIRLIHKIGDIRAETAYPTVRSELWIDMKNLPKTWLNIPAESKKEKKF